MTWPLLLVLSVATLPDFVRVAEEASSTVLTVDFRDVRVVPTPGGLRVEGPHLAHLMPLGSPDLPCVVVPVAIPPRGEVRVRSVARGITAHHGTVAEVEDSSAVSPEPLPTSWHKVCSMGWVRHQRILYLAVYPALPSPGGLHVATEVEVALEYEDPSPGTVEPDEAFQAVYGMWVNQAQAQRWRSRPPSPPLREPTQPPSQAVKVYVERKGVCVVRGSDLQEAGVDLASVPTASLRLTCRGQDVPFIFTGQTPTLQPGDSILFFARPAFREDRGCRFVDWWDHFTAANVYWLSWGSQPGVRFVRRDGSPSGTAPVVTWHTAYAHGEEDLMAFLSNIGDAPWPTEWYWRLWNAGTAGNIQNFTVTLDNPLSQQTGIILRAALHGYTNLTGVQWQHHTRFSLNGQLLGEVYWGSGSGRVPLCFDTQAQGITIPPSWIVHGTNILSVQLLPDIGPNGSLSASYFDWVGIRYDRALFAVQDTLEFSVPPSLGPGTWTIRVDNVSTPSVLVLDLVRGEQVVGAQHTGSTLAFQATVGDTSHFYVSSFARFVRPTKVVRERPSDPPLSQALASYLIITYDPESVGDQNPYHNLMDAAVDLALARGTTLPTRVIDVQNIYDEFNWGILNPTAIRDFLRFAFFSWSPPPSFVLLFGDASWDYLRRSGPSSKHTLVPCWGYPISENYFVELTEGDILPDVHIGRIPAENVIQADNAVAKVLAFGQVSPDPWSKRAVMVVGGNNEAEESLFEWHAEDLLSSYVLPAPFLGDSSTVYRTLTGYQPGYYNRRIVDAISRGCFTVNYIGHGAAMTWGIMFDVTDVASLTNGLALPVAMGLTCNSAAFGEPDTSTLGEVFLRMDGQLHGAIGFWGATARSSEWLAYLGSKAFLHALCLNLERRLGVLATTGKVAGGPTVIRMFALLGEPVVELPVPTGPDLAIRPESLWVSPPVVGELHDVTLHLTVENLGRATSVPVTVRVTGGPPGQETQVASLEDTCGARRVTRITLPWNTGPGVGPRVVSAHADATQAVSELREDNNLATLEFEALLAPPSPITPFDGQVVGAGPTRLAVHHVPWAAPLRYEFQLARAETIGPGAPGFVTSGWLTPQEDFVSWVTPPLDAGQTYFWRCRATEGTKVGAWSATRSFSTSTPAPQHMEWAQAHAGQFVSDSLSSLRVDRLLNTVLLQAGVNPTDYARTSQGATVPYVSSYCANPYTDPLNLVGENIGSGAGQYGQFLFDYNDYAQEALIDLGQVRWLGVVGSEHWIGADDRPVWSFYRVSSSVDNVNFVEWGSLGPFQVPDLDNIPTPMSFSVETPRPARYLRFEFGKGLPHPFPSGVLWGSRIYEVFAHAIDFFPSGTLVSPPVGPATQWYQVSWQDTVPPGTSLLLSVLEASSPSGPFAPVPGLDQLEASPVNLGGVTKPYVRLVASFSTSDPRQSPSLRRWSLSFRGGADMVFVAGLAVSPQAPPPGSTALVSATLANQGNAPADTVALALSCDDQPLWDTTYVSVLPAASLRFAVPWTVTPGLHVLRAVAVVRGQTPEAAPGDNEATVVVAVLPDPACASLQLETPVPHQLADVVFRGLLANAGVSVSDSLTWQLLVRPVGGDAFWPADSGAVGPLAPAETTGVRMRWAAPHQRGEWEALWRLAVGEPQASVANDTLSVRFSVVAPPDLAVDSLGFANRRPPSGDPVGVRVWVSNRGEAPASGTRLELWHAPPGSSGSLLSSWPLALTPGAWASFDTVFVTAGLPGSHSFWAWADPENVVPELDEANNRAADSVEVLSGVDLVCPSGLLVDQPVLTRDTVEALAVVRNAGEVDAGPFTVRWEAEGLSLVQADTSLPGLAGMTQRELRARFVAGTTPQTATVRLRLDPGDQVDETNEDNNLIGLSFSVLAEPDLSVRGEEIRLEPPAPIEEDTVRIRLVVHNLGQHPSAPCHATLAHRAGATGEWNPLPALDLPSIPGQWFVETDVPWVTPPAGQVHWLSITVNPDSSARELTLANNSGLRSFTVIAKDRDPPAVRLGVALAGFEDSAWVPATVPLVVHATDSGVGLDTASVTVYVDDLPAETTPATWRGSPRDGSWTLSVGPLAPGSHTVRATVADLRGNVGSSQQTVVRVADQEQGLRVLPMPRRTAHEVVLGIWAVRSERATITVSTVAGRTVRRWELDLSPPLTLLSWDLRDEDGGRVANGVYLVWVETASGDGAHTKVAVVR